MHYKSLGKTGIDVSVISFGGAPLGNEFGGIDVAECDRAVHLAIDRGITLFDTSPYYGRTLSESRLGDALQGQRNRIILSSKCGRYDVANFDFSESRVKSSVDESLRRLKPNTSISSSRTTSNLAIAIKSFTKPFRPCAICRKPAKSALSASLVCP